MSTTAAAQSKPSRDDEDEEDVVIKQFKIILLGDGAVGKTSIANRFTDDKFSQNYKQTVGVDFFIKRLNLPRKFAQLSPSCLPLMRSIVCNAFLANLQIALQIWDIGGQVSVSAACNPPSSSD